MDDIDIHQVLAGGSGGFLLKQVLHFIQIQEAVVGFGSLFAFENSNTLFNQEVEALLSHYRIVAFQGDIW